MFERILDEDLAAKVAKRLGVDGVPVDREGVTAFYSAWCDHVPFDNMRKLVGLREGARPLPGDDPNDFFDAWLRHGSGGTCWSSAGALYALATYLGFDAARVAGAMLDLPEMNHGSVVVTVDGVTWLLDSSMLTRQPLEIGAHESETEHCGYRASAKPDGETWIMRFESGLLDELPCRLYPGPRDAAEFSDRHERTRVNSVFNTAPYVLRHRPGAVESLHDLHLATWTSAGKSTRDLDERERVQWLVDVGGFSSELVDAVTRR